MDMEGSEGEEVRREWVVSDPECARLIEEMRMESLKPPKDSEVYVNKYVSDKEGFNLVNHIKPNQWRIYYNIGLYGRLGLYCYNFQKGTNYKFKYVSRWDTRSESLAVSFVTLKAMNPADSSTLSFETIVNHHDVGVAQGVKFLLETSNCSVEGSKEADPEWDNEAINVVYKDEFPQWFFNHFQQQRYVVKESELLDKENWWLHLFTEIAFYT